ncbi:MAG TPA: hypothetical protein VH063_14515 [Gaiellaceae bacterium]|nr:hypothetical protein [Gaiellaceae bacterium]
MSDATRAPIEAHDATWNSQDLDALCAFHTDDSVFSQRVDGDRDTPGGSRIEWDGVDVFPLRDGKIDRKDVYSSSHAPRVLSE